MKTTIHFISKKGEFIFSLYDNAVDSFKVGQKLWFDIEEIYPRTIDDLKKNTSDIMIKTILELNDELKNKYHNRRYKIIKKHTSLKRDYNQIKNTILESDLYSLSIEYTVKESPKFYWKWWYIKHIIKNGGRRRRK